LAIHRERVELTGQCQVIMQQPCNFSKSEGLTTCSLAACGFFEYNAGLGSDIETGRAMQVHVKLFSLFREHLPREARGNATIEMSEGATVENLLDHLGIVRRVKLITVNDAPETDRQRPLRDGDRVRIFPFVVGG
jgi:sulfur carrier protein ThiS